ELEGSLGVRLVVEEDEIDLVAEQASPAVYVVDPHLDRVHLSACRFGEASGLRNRPADQDLFVWPVVRAGGGRDEHQQGREHCNGISDYPLGHVQISVSSDSGPSVRKLDGPKEQQGSRPVKVRGNRM